jgi:meiosis induction protein kinase IME2/SME1
MAVIYDSSRGLSSPLTTNTGAALEDRFEVLKDIGDGSFGSVVLARVRSAGSNVARRGTVVSGFNSFRNAYLTIITDCNQDDEEEL